MDELDKMIIGELRRHDVVWTWLIRGVISNSVAARWIQPSLKKHHSIERSDGRISARISKIMLGRKAKDKKLATIARRPEWARKTCFVDGLEQIVFRTPRDTQGFGQLLRSLIRAGSNRKSVVGEDFWFAVRGDFGVLTCQEERMEKVVDIAGELLERRINKLSAVTLHFPPGSVDEQGVYRFYIDRMSDFPLYEIQTCGDSISACFKTTDKALAANLLTTYPFL